MRGHVARKGRRYYPVIETTDPKTGARRRQWHSGHNTKREAEAELRHQLGLLDAKIYVPPSKETVRRFLVEEWLPGISRQRRPGTVELYGVLIRAYVLPHVGAVRLQALTPRRLNALYDVLLERGGRRGRPLSAKTVKNTHQVLHRAFADAVRWGRLTRNPASLADPPRHRSPEMRTWTAEELRAFLDHVRHDRLYAAWLLVATTGMRRGELLGLGWRDLDLEAARVAVRRTLVMAGSRAAFSEPKTAKGRRSVPIPPETVAALRAHRRDQLEERLALGEGYEDGGLVFAREDGQPLSPDWLTRTFEGHVRAAGVPVIRLHDVRHSFASLALRANIHAKVVSEILGHASIGITLDTYSHAIPAMQEQAAAAVAALIFPGTAVR